MTIEEIQAAFNNIPETEEDIVSENQEEFEEIKEEMDMASILASFNNIPETEELIEENQNEVFEEPQREEMTEEELLRAFNNIPETEEDIVSENQEEFVEVKEEMDMASILASFNNIPENEELIEEDQNEVFEESQKEEMTQEELLRTFNNIPETEEDIINEDQEEFVEVKEEMDISSVMASFNNIPEADEYVDKNVEPYIEKIQSNYEDFERDFNDDEPIEVQQQNQNNKQEEPNFGDLFYSKLETLDLGRQQMINLVIDLVLKEKEKNKENLSNEDKTTLLKILEGDLSLNQIGVLVDGLSYGLNLKQLDNLVDKNMNWEKMNQIKDCYLSSMDDETIEKLIEDKNISWQRIRDIRMANDSGLDLKQIEMFSNNFNQLQRECILKGFEREFDENQMKQLTQNDLNGENMMLVLSAYENNLSYQEVEKMITPKLSPEDLKKKGEKIIEEKTKPRIKDYIKTYMKVIFQPQKLSVVNEAFKSKLSLSKIDMITNPTFNVEEMKMTLDSFKIGLDRYQIDKFVGKNYSKDKQMVIRDNIIAKTEPQMIKFLQECDENKMDINSVVKVLNTPNKGKESIEWLMNQPIEKETREVLTYCVLEDFDQDDLKQLSKPNLSIEKVKVLSSMVKNFKGIVHPTIDYKQSLELLTSPDLTTQNVIAAENEMRGEDFNMVKLSNMLRQNMIENKKFEPEEVREKFSFKSQSSIIEEVLEDKPLSRVEKNKRRV